MASSQLGAVPATQPVVGSPLVGSHPSVPLQKFPSEQFVSLLLWVQESVAVLQ